MLSRCLPPHARGDCLWQAYSPFPPRPRPASGACSWTTGKCQLLWAIPWWHALGQSHHARALTVRQAVLLFDDAPVVEAHHLVYGMCAPQAVIEVLEALVDEGQ